VVLDKIIRLRQSLPSGGRQLNSDSSENKGGIKQRLMAEIRVYLVISLYLWICFSALMLYETVVLRAENVQYLPIGTAAIKALIIGKFILIGKAINFGEAVRHTVLLRRILWKSLATLLLLLVFTTAEELVMGLVHGQSGGEIIAEMLDRSWLERLAPSSVMLLVLIPMIAFEEIDEKLGKGSLKRLLFDRSERE